MSSLQDENPENIPVNRRGCSSPTFGFLQYGIWLNKIINPSSFFFNNDAGTSLS